MAYKPRPVPSDIKNLPSWLSEELRRLGSVGLSVPAVYLQELHVAPDRPRAGMIVLADGTNWNPGSGQGIYAYYNSTWNKL